MLILRLNGYIHPCIDLNWTLNTVNFGLFAPFGLYWHVGLEFKDYSIGPPRAQSYVSSWAIKTKILFLVVYS